MRKPSKDHPWKRSFATSNAEKREMMEVRVFYQDVWEKHHAKKTWGKQAKALRSTA